MSQFAALNNAVLLIDAPTNWPLGLTADIENDFKKNGSPVVVEVVFPDVGRNESGTFFLNGQIMLHAPMQVRVEALLTTNMIPPIRAARAKLGGLWLVMNIESVKTRAIENDNEEFVLQGKALAIDPRPADEWIKHVGRSESNK
jgi:hypothetical protein